jgi:shikimate kinase
MGVGKTTIGRALAKSLNLKFYDLDWYIESRRHKTVKQLFDENGEEGFREIERNMLHEVAEFEDVVVSCGGGTPCFFDNMDYMNRQGETLYLKATPEVLYQHLKMGRNVRPLLLNKTQEELMTFITEQLSQREPFYSKARHTIDVSLLNNYDAIDRSVEQVRNIVTQQ